MAVAPVSKVTIIGYAPVLGDVVDAVQRAGLLHVETQNFDLPGIELTPDDARLRELDDEAAKIRFVVEFLGHRHTNDQPFSTFVSEKHHLTTDAYRALRYDERSRALYEDCLDISDRLASGEREKAELTALVADLEPWTGLRRQIKAWRCTTHTVLLTGTVPSGAGPDLRQRLREAAAEVTVEEIEPIGSRQAWVVLAHQSVESAVRSVLADSAFSEVSFPGLTESPAEEYSIAVARIEALEAEHALLAGRAQELADVEYAYAVAMETALQSAHDRLTVRREFGSTERTFVVTGWIRDSSQDALSQALSAWGELIDVAFRAPTTQDSPPVELDNPAWLRPLEVLTDLYGRPQYHEMDPTPFLAPFFLIYFGICIGDVGYGLMLIVAAQLIKAKLDITPGVKRFMDLLTYGGVVAMAFGVAFGSYLAIPVDKLPAILRAMQVLDPLADLVNFLIFTMILGVVQVFFGVLIAAYDAFRRGDAAEGVFGQLSTVFLFAMIATMVLTGQGVWLALGLVGTMLMQGRALESALGDSSRPMWDRALGASWLVAIAVSIYLMGFVSVGMGLLVLGLASVAGAVVSRCARAAVIGMLSGAYSVYGMTGFVGDILSYTRLAALGLSGSLVGFVFNLLAGLVWSPAMGLMEKGVAGIVGGVVVAVLAAAVFVVGHVFNVVINLLGAFVHPARLQFVEFFGKFYEGGGVRFAPFSFSTENLVLEAGAAGPDGGAGK